MFDEEITRMEQEIRDLRTAHPRGLGMMNFSTYSDSPSSAATEYPYYYNVFIYFDQAGLWPPLIELASTYGAMSSPLWNSHNRSILVTLNAGDSRIPVISVVASSKIISMTIVPDPQLQP